MSDQTSAALAAIEVIIWQLVNRGVLPNEPLAAELRRYASFSPGAAKTLQLLAFVAEGAAPPSKKVAQSGVSAVGVGTPNRISTVRH